MSGIENGSNFNFSEAPVDAADFEVTQPREEIADNNETEAASPVEEGRSWLDRTKQAGKDLLLSYFSLGDGDRAANFIGKALGTTVSGVGIASLSELPAVVGHHMSTNQKEVASAVTLLGLAGLGMTMYQTYKSNQARKQEMANQ